MFGVGSDDGCSGWCDEFVGDVEGIDGCVFEEFYGGWCRVGEFSVCCCDESFSHGEW